jgi:hypothetical protein
LRIPVLKPVSSSSTTRPLPFPHNELDTYPSTHAQCKRKSTDFFYFLALCREKSGAIATQCNPQATVIG